jgi:predicted 3-demethylubiquinone-9 3-methyltransferase (glyoxalase superfamily)
LQKVTPFLWFDGQAEEAMNYYVSIFPNSKIVNTNPMGGMFEIDGQQFMTLNGGPMYKFAEAISLYVNCEAQEEVDELWEKLSAGGEKGRCGWLKDKYGLSWQITPRILPKLITDPDQEKGRRVMQAMMKMKKIVIKDLEDAYNQN